jgi:hypothetical protein
MSTTKITNIDAKIEQLQNQRKQLLQREKQAERKARTKRLIERGAILESLIPNATGYSNEEIQTFLKQTITTPFAQKHLAGLRGGEG